MGRKSGKVMMTGSRIEKNGKISKNIRITKNTPKIKSSANNIQEDLLQTVYINLQINSKLEEISYWREMASKAGSVFYSETGTGIGSGNKKRSKVEDCVCKIADIENSVKDDMTRLYELKEKISHTIDKIKEPECKSLLIHRYLCGKKWEQVAEDMGYSYVHVVHRLHPKALKKINEIGTGENHRKEKNYKDKNGQ
ncbi:MAG: hypothetical protein FWD71_13455 [Oscillospiraceae bacterium]|nr:hypothetical protein [Oscillospiraceae bacterium]